VTLVFIKKSTSELKERIISIAAILNKHQKGMLYFGIKNDRTVIGQEISEKTLREYGIQGHFLRVSLPRISLRATSS